MLRAVFIGVDKHTAPEIRDLAGAARDATALWALFGDSIEEIVSERLTDVSATADEIRRALRSALGDAEAGDSVLVTFSGHGTRNHRLVAHDTARATLDQTTIGMDELSALFRQSRADSVFCLVDCCFSGDAPGRVFDDTPVPRAPGTPLEEVAGRGRVLLAACNVNEVAYESPVDRHGLLTRAVLDALQVDRGDGVDVVAAMADVLASVRASAGRLGVTQTPVLFGHIEGGLRFPRLRAGARFRTAFPETAGAIVTNDLQDLTSFGVPQTVIDEWVARFRGGLNALQLAAVNDYRVIDGESLLVVAPTSSGKTFVGELAGTKAILDGRKTVFLFPYRALVNEKFDSFTSLYGERLGMRVIRCTGDYTDQGNQFIRGKYDLAVLTYEMFLNLVVRNPATLNQIGLVVLDEAQFVTDPMRGISVELLLTFLLSARERGVAPQLISLSAVIGNINHFDEWLGCRSLVHGERPVPLIEGVLDRSGTFQFLDAAGQQQTAQLLPRGAVQLRRDEPSAQDVIVPLVRQLITGTNEKVIVFRNQRGAAEGCAAYLANEVGLAPAEDALRQLPDRDLSSTSASLRRCLQGGTAFHNTNLTREEKQVVERSYRDPASPLRVLGATTTVAAGINTPASTVVIAEQQFVGEDGRPFTVAEYKNMAGRAGRLGFNEQGKSIILAETPHQRQVLFDRYVLGRLESIQRRSTSRSWTPGSSGSSRRSSGSRAIRSPGC